MNKVEVEEEGIEIDNNPVVEQDFIPSTESVAHELEDLKIQGVEDETIIVTDPSPEAAYDDEVLLETEESTSLLSTPAIVVDPGEDDDAISKDITAIVVDDHDCINKLANIKIEPKEPECQFFGSFYNEKQLKEPSIDLVTFSASCRITEIRVIPLGATAEMLDGVALLGSTNPTHFDLEFYYEDLTDPGSATFKAIDQFTYDDKLSIQLLCGSDENPIITNKILVRGLYSSVTLAIIGYEIENFPVRIPSPELEIISEDLAYNTSPDSQPERGSSEEEGEIDASSFYDDEADRSEEEGEGIKTEIHNRDDYSSHSDSEINDDVEMIDTFDTYYDDDYTREETPTYVDTPWQNFEQTGTPSPSPDEHAHEQEERLDESETEQNRLIIDEDNLEMEEKPGSFCSEDSYVQGELDGADLRSLTEVDLIQNLEKEHHGHDDDDLAESDIRSTSSSPVVPEASNSVVTEVTHLLVVQDESVSHHFVPEVTLSTTATEMLNILWPETSTIISPETSNLISPEMSNLILQETLNPVSPESSNPISQELSNDRIYPEISNTIVTEILHPPVTPEISSPNALEAEVSHPVMTKLEMSNPALPELSRPSVIPEVMAKGSLVRPSFLDTEDISDGDISSAEDEDNGDLNVDNEQSIPCSIPLSVSTPPLTPVVDEEKQKATFEKDSDKQNETLSDQDQFEYDFEYDLEVISDDEINDYPESDQASDMGDYEDLPFIYGRPYDVESFKFHRPQNYWVELYPRKYLSSDSLLKEKLRETMNQYSPAAFKLKMQILESWVESTEEILPIIIPFLHSLPSKKLQASTDILCFWARECFQPLPSTSSEPVSVTVNLRQLKLGIKLVFCLCEFDSILTNEVCDLTLNEQKTKIQTKLVEILVESRSPVVQYLSIKALESTINTFTGLRRLSQAETPNEDNLLTKLVVEHMNTKLSRFVTSSLESFFEKVNFVKLLMNIEEFAESSTNMDDKNGILKLYADMSLILETFENFDMNSSSSDAALAITMSKHLPATYDPKTNRVKLLKEANFIDACFKLMTRFNSDYKLLNLLVGIFQCLLKWEVGIVYLAEDFTSGLLRIFSQTDLCESNGVEFAVYFTQCMTVMKCIDQCPQNMRNLSVKQADEVIDSLHEVYLLLAYESGRRAITHLFTTGNFIERLLDCVKFAEIVAAEGDKIKQFEKTTIGGYAVDILVHVIRTADHLNFLEDHGAEIDRLFKSLRENFEGYEKLKEVMPYMEPTLQPTNFLADRVVEICDTLKAKTDGFLKSEVNWGFTPEIITILRILDGLSNSRFIPNSSSRTNDGECGAVGEVLRLKVVAVNLNSTDILSTLMGMLTRLIDEYKQPAIHAHEFLHGKGDALVSLVLPTVRIIRNLLTRLIRIKNTNFRDLSFIPVLLPLYALMDAFPENSNSAKEATKIRVHIIACLQTFTIPVIQLGEQSEETLMNSMWTKMVSEIITFTMTTPCNFISGMTILSELQPLNLPIVSTEELPESVKVQLVSLRRLWSAFLHGVTPQFQEMIGILCESTNRELVTLVRRVCLQVADLSAASCLMTCRGIMEPIMASMESDLEEKGKGKVNSDLPSSVTAWVEVSRDRLNVQCSARTTRLLGFLSSLMKRSGVIKAGVMHVTRASSKLDEKFSEFVTMLGCILTTTHRKATSFHVKAQDYVMSIFYSLCNLKINMFNSTDSEITESKLDFDYLKSNSLPQKDTLTLICSSLLTFLGLQDNILGNVAIIRKIFFGLNVLSISEYGFYHLRLALSKNPTTVHDLIVKLKTKNFETLDIVGVMEYLEVIDSVLRFLRNLITPHPYKSGTPEFRKSILSKTELRKLLGWSSPETSLNHPLLQLCTYLRACVAREKNKGPEGEEQEYLKTYMADAKEKLDKVLSFVESSSAEGQVMVEIAVNPPDSLHEQFARRPVVVPWEIVDHYQKIEHLNLITQDRDVNFEFSTNDLVLCNLLESTKECMTADFTEAEFLVDLEKFCNLAQEEEEPTTSQKHETTYGDMHARPNYFDLLSNFQGSTTSTQAKLNFMRGISGGRVGFGRGLNTRPSFDPFRSRPPNTSRPPSLHVDDFVAMESSSQGSSTSSRGRPGNEVFRGRGVRGIPSPLSRSFNQDRGRGFRSSSSASPFYLSRNEPASMRGRSPLRGRGFSGGNERWLPSPGGGDNSGSPGRNYGGGRQDDGPNSNYLAGRHYGGRGYRDMLGRLLTPGGSNQSGLHQQQRWRNKPNQFNR